MQRLSRVPGRHPLIYLPFPRTLYHMVVHCPPAVIISTAKLRATCLQGLRRSRLSRVRHRQHRVCQLGQSDLPELVGVFVGEKLVVENRVGQSRKSALSGQFSLYFNCWDGRLIGAHQSGYIWANWPTSRTLVLFTLSLLSRL